MLILKCIFLIVKYTQYTIASRLGGEFLRDIGKHLVGLSSLDLEQCPDIQAALWTQSILNWIRHRNSDPVWILLKIIMFCLPVLYFTYIFLEQKLIFLLYSNVTAASWIQDWTRKTKRSVESQLCIQECDLQRVLSQNINISIKVIIA